MLKLKIAELMAEKGINTRQLSELTGIRWNTVDDLAKNKAKHWSPVHLDQLMKVFDLKSVGELIESIDEINE